MNNSLKSEFRLFTYIIVPLFLFFLLAFVCSPFIIYYTLFVKFEEPKELFLLIFPCLFIFSFWLLIYVIRFKCDVIVFTKKDIIIKKLFGTGRKRQYSFREITISPSWEHVKIGDGGKLLIYKDEKRITEISDLCYSNYHSIENYLKKHKVFTKFRNDSYWSRLKQAVIF